MMLKLVRKILLPLSPIYGLVVCVRNYLYDNGWFKSSSFDFPIINVGNVLVGGTGKTPMIEYLLEFLSPYSVATLSRGYGRKTKGYIKSNAGSTAEQIGDEPAQLKHKYPQIMVSVCEDRKYGIEQLMPECDVILLDDAFQHRKVKAGLNIVLFDYDRAMRNMFFLPSGDLREGVRGASRADIVLITKCPKNVSPKERLRVVSKLRLGKEQKVYYTSIAYGEPQKWQSGEVEVNVLSNSNVLLLTGIAQPQPLVDYIESRAKSVQHLAFGDHHFFTDKDMEDLKMMFERMASPKVMITTEKDAERLKGLSQELKSKIASMPIFTIGIKAEFLDKEEEFRKIVKEYVERNKRNNSIHQK